MGDTNLGGIPPSAVDVPQAYTNLTNPDRSSDRYVSDSALTEPLDHPHPLGDDQDSSGLSDTPKIRQGTVPLDPGLASNDTCLADVGTSLAESNSPSQLSSQGGSRDHPIVRNASPCSWSQDDPSRSSQSKIIEKRLLNAAFTVFNSRSSSLPLPTAELRNEDPSDLRGSSSFPSSAESLCSESHPSVSECTVPYTSVYHYHAGDRVNQGMGATLEDHVVDTMEEHSVAELRMEEMGDNSDNQDAEAKMETQAVDVMERQATEAQILATNTCSGGQESKTWTVNLPRELQQSDGMATNNSSENNQAAFVSAASEVMTVKAAAAVDLLLPQEVTKEEQRAKVTPFWKCEGGGVKWTADMMHKGGQQEGENMQAEEQLKERGTKEQVENAGWEEIQGALGVSGHGGELKDNKEEEPEHPRGREQEPEPPVPQVCMSEECWAASPTLESEEAEPNEGARPSERMATSSQLGSENQLRGKETTHGKELWSRKAENTVTDNKETIQTDTASSTEEPAENPERAAAGEETPPAIHSPGQAKRVPPLTRGEVSTGSAEGSPGGLSVPSAGVEQGAFQNPGFDAGPEYDTVMSSRLGVFSTTLKVQPSLGSQTREDRKQHFHKVSLVTAGEPAATKAPGAAKERRPIDGAHDNNATATSQGGQGQRTVQVVEERFDYEEGDMVPQFSSYSSPFPLSFHSDTDALHLPSPSAPQESGSFTLSLDQPRSLGNSGWLSEGSEVHPNLERVPGGRDWAESPAMTGERDREWRINTGWDSRLVADGHVSPVQNGPHSGIFKATFVELLPSPTSSDPDSPQDMDTLVDTLKSLESTLRHRTSRHNSTSTFNSLPPIVEDASSPDPKSTEPKGFNGSTGLDQVDQGLGLSLSKERLSPLEMLKWRQEQETPHPRTRSFSLPLFPSLERSPDATSPDSGPPAQQNGAPAPSLSRLEGSLLFSNYWVERSAQNGQTPAKNPLFRASSLPDSGPTRERVEPGQTGSRAERFSLFTSPIASLTGAPEPSPVSAPPPLTPSALGEVARLPTSPPDSLVLHRSLSLDRALGTPSLTDPRRGPPPTAAPQPERSAVLKYRAFPDAYLTKEKEHGKLNPRPGKMYIYDKPGLTGQRIEVHSDVIDATAWDLPETIFIRVVRGGWVLYEKPNFKGEKFALDEGDTELTYPFGPPEERQDSGLENGVENGQDGEQGEEMPPQRKFVIGSLRRAVRDYSVPDISLFPEENAEGKKVIFRDTSEDARIYGFPIRANSIIINAGLWLVFAQPFFEGKPQVLEVGGYPNPASWGVSEPYVGSLHPLKIGEPTVEFPNEPKLIIYEKPYFTGKSREIYTNMRDFITRVDRKQSAFMFSAGSIQVVGGCWVGYEKEGFRGHQYLLEEGEYHDWRVWGGCDSELRSVRLIQADLSEPMLILYEMAEEEEGVEEAEKRTFEVTEAIPDVEPFEFRTMSSSIHVLSGVWIAYSHVDFSGKQYVLEKGFYSSCADWGAEDNRICSLQPIRKVRATSAVISLSVLLYSEPNFQGTCLSCDKNQPSLPDNFSVKSCRVLGGSWAAYEDSQFSGNLYVLSEGDYPNFASMGCPPSCSLRSLKIIPLMFTMPSISLFGLECFEGREVTLDTEVLSLTVEGFNNDFMSVRVNSGCWVICEHSYYKGRQILLEPIEISNWHKYSELFTIGSLYPIRQKRCFFRIKNKERGHYLSIQGGMEEMKSGRVVVMELVEGFSDLWFYQDGLIKNKLAPTMSLQVMGNVEAASKVVLWSETRVPIQNWSISQSGVISSLTFSGFVLDVKGGKTYDRDHVVIWGKSDERPSQQWELEVL
ncbi:absent in melanoma 1 protein-like [Arapaima gigas]